MFRAAVLTGTVFLLFSEAALAQTRLPRVSPSEQQVQEINRALQRQQRSLAVEQQRQFEVNQLRQELRRQQTFPSMTGSGGVGRICPPGRVVC
jgi:uncharacterized membrane protein (DUF106 family)